MSRQESRGEIVDEESVEELGEEADEEEDYGEEEEWEGEEGDPTNEDEMYDPFGSDRILWHGPFVDTTDEVDFEQIHNNLADRLEKMVQENLIR